MHLPSIPKGAIRANETNLTEKKIAADFLKQLISSIITIEHCFIKPIIPDSQQNRREPKQCISTMSLSYIKDATVARIMKTNPRSPCAYVPVDFHFRRQGASFIQYEAGHFALCCRLDLHGSPRLQRCGFDPDHTRLFIAFPLF